MIRLVKIQKNPTTGQFWVTIPKQIAEFKQWGKGTELEVLEHEKGSVVLRENGK
ncbi:MAG: hypothetical protein QMC80_07335 [Thermoplasmatales archaeon]|nr:hypothetical protein [Thermoplasmatales archaeon]